MKRNIGIKTGEDLWAIIVGEDLSFIKNAVTSCIVISEKMWGKQEIKIVELDRNVINKVKKSAKTYA